MNYFHRQDMLAALNRVDIHESRFVYRVPGAVSIGARAALNHRYGEQGWYSEWERLCDAEARKRSRGLGWGFDFDLFEPSFVMRPADPTGWNEK